jgi:hypothetical protein
MFFPICWLFLFVFLTQVLLLGDTVYVDIPLIEDSAAYAQVWSDAAFAELFTRVPFVAIFDDHELENDWSLSHEHWHFHRGMKFFDEWLGSKNPRAVGEEKEGKESRGSSQLESGVESEATLRPSSPIPPYALDPSHPSVRPRYFTFQRGRHAEFFVLDTRQYATPVEVQDEESDASASSKAPRFARTKLGSIQLRALKHWLLSSRSTFKFICSSVSWSSTAFKFVQDGWGSYLSERNALFDFIVAEKITGVVLLSADLHWSAIFHFQQWNLYEISVSPLQSFGLPHWITSSETERTVWSSTWRQHAGQIEIYENLQRNEKSEENRREVSAEHDSSDTFPSTETYLNVSIFRYTHGHPKRATSLILTASRMKHGRVEHSTAEHEEP